MSYPNPNPNPYGPPPGQQPGYGYPQQPPQPQQPQQPLAPYSPYPGGPYVGGPMPAAQMPYPTVMPSSVKTARVMLFVLAGLNLIGLVLSVVMLGVFSKASHEASSSPYADSSAFAVTKGFAIAAIVVIVIFTAAALTLAAQFGNGSNGVRISTIVFGAGTTLLSFASFPLGLIHTALGITVIVMASKDESKSWFNRPRH
ncbi:hypothetical protein ABT168_18705 [Streptomyces sp. NPDC001793]|uniref:hypothetical protein n=1 Tax=Streptomyces sp. NPDC001793 TaxID=3154657 RepID=UPI003322C4F1